MIVARTDPNEQENVVPSRALPRLTDGMLGVAPRSEGTTVAPACFRG